MMPAIKICGLQTEEDVGHLFDIPVQFAGFVLAESPRKITINKLCKLVNRLPRLVTPVVVTVNAPVSELGVLIEKAGVTHIQLHGDEDPAYCEQLREIFGQTLRLIKALPARGEETLAQISRYENVIDTLLIDTYQPHQRGGSGKTFQWESIPAYQETAQRAGLPLWIAGGLNPDNVKKLVTRYHPDGVDVSSGVEHNHKKCAKLVSQFVKRVRQHDKNRNSTE